VKRILILLGLVGLFLVLGGADGSCGLSFGSFDPMNVVGVCGGHASIFACNIPKTFTDAEFKGSSTYLNAPPCGLMVCVADLDGAYAHADTLLSKDAATAAADGLRCILVGAGLGDASRFIAPPQWNAPGGCVLPASGADAGASAACSMLNQLCNNSADVAQEHTCCPGVVCSADENTEDAVGTCCALPSSAVAGVRCGADTDCCQAAVGMARCVEGACCYDTGAQCSLAADECCSGLSCQDTGTGEAGYGTCEP